MKITIDKGTTQASMEASIAQATRLGANCAKVALHARKTSHVYKLEKVVGLLGQGADIEFGRQSALGLPFKSLNSAVAGALIAPARLIVPSATTEIITDEDSGLKVKLTRQQSGGNDIIKIEAPVVFPTPTPKAAPRPHLRRPPGVIPPGSRGTGFIAYIDQMLLDTAPGKVSGYIRSKFSVDDATRKVLVRFPGKSPASVKRIVKVRPRHLERIKSRPDYGEGKPAPRWRWVGPGHGSGYMHRIDELLTAGGMTTKQIAEVVAKEFTKDLPTALKVVRMRTSQYEAKHGKPAKFVRVQAKPRKPTEQKRDRAKLKRKNLALLAASSRAKRKKR